jgi:uncharacterized protein RhaS with RHS repeats
LCSRYSPLGAIYPKTFVRFWLNRDPIGIAGGLNLYAYAANNPISGIDPLGLADLVLISKYDDYYNAAVAIPSGGAMFTMVSHGQVEGKGFSTNFSGSRSISIYDLLDAIKNALKKGKYKTGQTIRCYSCYGGVGKNLDTLKQIAKALNATIIAATTEVVAATQNGKFVDVQNEHGGPVAWIAIAPDGSVSAYTGP